MCFEYSQTPRFSVLEIRGLSVGRPWPWPQLPLARVGPASLNNDSIDLLSG